MFSYVQSMSKLFILSAPNIHPTIKTFNTLSEKDHKKEHSQLAASNSQLMSRKAMLLLQYNLKRIAMKCERRPFKKHRKAL